MSIKKSSYLVIFENVATLDVDFTQYFTVAPFERNNFDDRSPFDNMFKCFFDIQLDRYFHDGNCIYLF